MKKYTQYEFEAIVRDKDGYLRLPTGDYSDIDFARENKIIFAAGSILGDECKLGNGCVLGSWCVLGNGCMLGNSCELGDGCILGNRCVLGDWCVLGDGCKLGRQCRLGRGCSMEGGRVSNAAYYIVTNIGRRNDDAYAYCNTATGEIYVRAGCWFSGIDEFIKRVHEVHAGTQHEVDYMAFAEFARARFRKYEK